MAGIVDRIQGLWDLAKAGPAKTRLSFPVPRDHVDRGADLGPPFAPEQHYFQIIINEMFLSNERAWHVHYEPMVFAASSYIYDRKVETLPMVVGPALLKQYIGQNIPEGMIYRNTPISGLHPYQGGPLTLTILLNRLQRQNSADKLLQIVESVSSAFIPSTAFTAYLALSGPIVDGIEAILDLPETAPIAGCRIAINPDIRQVLEPTYFVLVDAEDTPAERERFWVQSDRLYYGRDQTTAKPYRAHDFVLFSIAQGDTRTDESTLPFFSLWTSAQDLAAQPNDRDWTQAKAHFNTLHRSLISSPDLTTPDERRLSDKYLREIKEVRERAVMQSQLAPSFGPSDAILELDRVASELDELDEL